MSERNHRVFRHYRECAAVGRFPDDPIVRRNAGIIRDVLEQIEQDRQQRLITALMEFRTVQHGN
jgi:hypothetical protein